MVNMSLHSFLLQLFLLLTVVVVATSAATTSSSRKLLSSAAGVGSAANANKPWVTSFAKEKVQLQWDDWCLTRDYLLNIPFLHECVKEGEPGFDDQHFQFKESKIYIEKNEYHTDLCLTQAEECRQAFWASTDVVCQVYFTSCEPSDTDVGRRQLWEAQGTENDFSNSFMFIRKVNPTTKHMHNCLMNPWDHSKQAKPAKDFPLKTYTCNPAANMQIFYSYRALPQTSNGA
ncbi:hypothetical protein NFJ02_05g119550 [Pycnococcus provasolii]